MSERKQDCELCQSVDTLKRIPCNFSLDKQNNEIKTGAIVKKSIEEFRQDLNEERERLKNEFFEPDK